MLIMSKKNEHRRQKKSQKQKQKREQSGGGPNPNVVSSSPHSEYEAAWAHAPIQTAAVDEVLAHAVDRSPQAASKNAFNAERN